MNQFRPCGLPSIFSSIVILFNQQMITVGEKMDGCRRSRCCCCCCCCRCRRCRCCYSCRCFIGVQEVQYTRLIPTPTPLVVLVSLSSFGETANRRTGDGASTLSNTLPNALYNRLPNTSLIHCIRHCLMHCMIHCLIYCP